MIPPQIIDETITVDANLGGGKIRPHSLTWRKKKYTIISVGRQWLEADLRHILIELHDGSRMEIMMYTNLTWQLHRYWPSIQMA